METKNYYAQYGEDKILDEIFDKKDGICVEVGGFDGVTGSNTYFFERLGWRCLVVEPMPDFCKKIREARSCEVVEIAASDKTGEVEFFVAVGVETLSTLEKDENHFARIRSLSQQEMKKITVKTARLDDILLEHGITAIDFLTIDVEGHEMSVLAGTSFDRISPRIVIIEDISYGLDRQVKFFMQSMSYVRFKKTGCNDWYAKKDDQLVTLWNVIATEIPIFLYVVKQKIKPFAPRWLKRSTT
ncbi:MAG: FkbM family methyltransferase [Pseudomonadota bacterium]